MNYHTFLNKKIIRATMLFSCIFVFSSCISEYREHFRSEHSIPPSISSEYSLLSPESGIWVLPNSSIKDDIINSISQAQERIWIEIYMWTDQDIMDAMIDAHKRGVDVRVLLERNVYDLPRVNMRVYTELENAGIPIRFTDSYRFTFTHAKFWIIDTKYYISSGNLTQSFFKSNRDFVYYSSDTTTLNFLSDLFLGDFSYLGIDRSSIPNHIVLSPVDARNKLEYLIGTAEKDIVIYTQTLTDDSIMDLLTEKHRNGISVQICTADNESNRESSQKTDMRWTYLKKPYLHGKIIFIDGNRFFLGSQNLTTNSLENNREVGIILSDSGALWDLLYDSYAQDCVF